MAFNSGKFQTTNFKDRTLSIDVPELKPFFDDDDKPVWVLKCIDSNHVAIARDHVKNNRNREMIVDSLFKDSLDEKLLDEIKDKIGVKRSDGKVHNDVVFRKALIMFASVEPVCNEIMALKIGENYPEVFDRLANAALQLIGMGSDPGELKPCGETTESK